MIGLGTEWTWDQQHLPATLQMWQWLQHFAHMLLTLVCLG